MFWLTLLSSVGETVGTVAADWDHSGIKPASFFRVSSVSEASGIDTSLPPGGGGDGAFASVSSPRFPGVSPSAVSGVRPSSGNILGRCREVPWHRLNRP